MMKKPTGERKLTEWIRHHVAISAVGSSAGRNMMVKGEIEGVREFLDKLDIKQFSKPTRFQCTLDAKTKSLARRLSRGGWGAARKFINLFLRTATYNFYLRKRYKLDRVEALLELPLDKFAGKALRSESEGKTLPRWKGVIHLTPESSAHYQTVAAQVGARMSMCRVHLDMLYWRREKER
jgi:hypothetical protein